MSTDTPRPERVTLTNEERESLTCDCAIMADDPTWPETLCPFHAERLNLEVGGPAGALLDTVEHILVAREQALREEIAGEIEAEAHPFRALSDPNGHRATLHAARIARGEQA